MEKQQTYTAQEIVWLANGLVSEPRATRILARVLVLLFVVLVVALRCAPWQQSAYGTGRVVAYAPLDRQQAIEAPIEGRIVHWHVREGSIVRAGDPVVDLTDNDPEIIHRLREEYTAMTARLDAAKARALSVDSRMRALRSSRGSAVSAAQQRARMATDRVRSAEEALRAAEAASKTAKLNEDRQSKLLSEGLTSVRAFELAELEVIRAQTESDRARAALSAARSEALALDADLSKVGNDGTASIDDARASHAAALAEIASAQAEVARIEVRLARQQSQAIKAPRDGVILRLVANQGTELVKAGDPLAILVPDSETRAVELWVDGNDVPLITNDRHVRLQFEGWPAVQFAGWPSVAVGTFGGKVSLVDASDDGSGNFRVLVVPDGKEPWPSGVFLRQGTQAHGWVLLSRVRLGYELWRQFNGFPPVVASDEAAALKGKNK